MKPCPFCGSSAVGPGYRDHPDGHELTMISCSSCGANGPVRAYATQYDDDEAAANWDKWPSRARADVSDPLLVVLQAAQGCGKTLAAPLVAKATGCERIYADDPDHGAISRDLYNGRRVLVCTNEDYRLADDAAPVLRLTIEGDRPADTLRFLLVALGFR